MENGISAMILLLSSLHNSSALLYPPSIFSIAWTGEVLVAGGRGYRAESVYIEFNVSAFKSLILVSQKTSVRVFELLFAVDGFAC